MPMREVLIAGEDEAASARLAGYVRRYAGVHRLGLRLRDAPAAGDPRDLAPLVAQADVAIVDIEAAGAGAPEAASALLDAAGGVPLMLLAGLSQYAAMKARPQDGIIPVMKPFFYYDIALGLDEALRPRR